MKVTVVVLYDIPSFILLGAVFAFILGKQDMRIDGLHQGSQNHSQLTAFQPTAPTYSLQTRL